MPDMVAHASSAGAPFDSEVSTADLDSEAFATTPSATPPPTTLSTTEAMQLDMLNQLLDSHASSASTVTTGQNNTTESSTLPNDHSIIAMASTTSSNSVNTPWLSSPSIAPSALKLELPLLTCLASPPAASSKTRSRPNRSSTSKATSPPPSGATKGRKRSGEPLDKDAKARERVLRNRAAAQESRDKKRKYVVEIETSNENLQQENCQLLKRLKTVESDNLALSQRLEALTVQFAQMQEQLAQSLKQNNNNIINNPGAGFCQSAVLAKKDKRSRQTDNLTNSPQQKLAPLKGNLHTTISTHNNHQRVYSMTMKISMSKVKGQNREARLSDPSAAQNRMETSCRSSCINRNRALTLSSSAAASFPITRQRQLLATTTTVFMMFYLSMVLPQLMLNFSTLFLISTGTRSNDLPTAAQPSLHPQEQCLQQAILSFIRRLPLSRLSNQEARNHDHHNRATATPSTQFHSKLFKDNITSLGASVIEEIVTEFRQGRKDVARGLLVEALLSRRFTLGNDSIKGLLFLLLKK
ncbi:hypothetical protein BG011_000146 [Mortierella polycephala]|uniref:BZIP domain-containing protein n=1 Tax=Mortierella polycephala TaxID=41804 RepID=A0A9P6TVH5_9FUNG|nr:hypothetical protein BG011_000146 [Mortierella polycephala]